MRASKKATAEIVREYGPFSGVDHVHGVTYDGQHVWFAAGDKLIAFAPAGGKTLRSIEVAAHAGTAFDGTHLGDAAFTGVHAPVYYGPDVAAALEWVSGFSCVSDILQRLDPGSTARARERLRQALGEHASEDGVWFGSRAWIVTARRR